MTCLCAFVPMERCGIAAEKRRTCLPSEFPKETKNSASNHISNSQHSVFRIQVILGEFGAMYNHYSGHFPSAVSDQE